ncbi:hypothetical protein QFZ69_004760 [Arthrobacter sp. V1I7]|uniref:hypothetical protein n=1 Tax=Arthrobacter sp. V1I7 TaxID=3042274 RepID=UPI0027882879|nr:hypothetical protein [Arthrobacter sp. V1I7]MDQ0823814.1 hypothetical protein [Arthrobacter sp. V1I7]
MRRTEEDLEAAEAYIDRWIDIDVNDAIAKARARLEQETTPDLAAAPLTPGQRELLVKAPKEAHSMVPEFMHRGYPAEDVEHRQLQDDLGRFLGYHGPSAG